jgi:hypothetical protein
LISVTSSCKSTHFRVGTVFAADSDGRAIHVVTNHSCRCNEDVFLGNNRSAATPPITFFRNPHSPIFFSCQLLCRCFAEHEDLDTIQDVGRRGSVQGIPPKSFRPLFGSCIRTLDLVNLLKLRVSPRITFQYYCVFVNPFCVKWCILLSRGKYHPGMTI